MAHVFCVFLCFSFRHTLAHNYPCVLRVFVFFFQTNVRSQPMCFACFFVINKYLSSTSSQGRHPMCFMCFCVFLLQIDHRPQLMCFTYFCVFFIQNYLEERFSRTRQNATLVFYVFLCFSSKNSDHNQCVSRVFVFFPNRIQVTTPVFYVFLCFYNIQIFRSISSQGRRPMCFMCFCVFCQVTGNIIHVFYVFLCFHSKQISGHTYVFYMFLCFLL